MDDSHRENLSVLQAQILSLQESIKNSQSNTQKNISRPLLSRTRHWNRNANIHKHRRTVGSHDGSASQHSSSSNSHTAFKILWGTKRSVSTKDVEDCVTSAQFLDPESFTIKLSNRFKGNWWYTISGSPQVIARLFSQYGTAYVLILTGSFSTHLKTAHELSPSPQVSLIVVKQYSLFHIVSSVECPIRLL